MLHQIHIPLQQGMLQRPRLHALIQKGLENSPLIFLAGPGFGKTQALADYLNHDEEARVLWFRAGNPDNLYTYFWERLIRALEGGFQQTGGHGPGQLQKTGQRQNNEPLRGKPRGILNAEWLLHGEVRSRGNVFARRVSGK